MQGRYLNHTTGVAEHFLEPLHGDVHVENLVGSAITSITMVTRKHLILNITSALVDNVKDAARLIAVHWVDTYHTEALRIRRWDTKTGGQVAGVAANGRVLDRAMMYSFKVRNRVGCDISIFGAVSWEHGVGEEDETSWKQKHRKVKLNNSPPHESADDGATNVEGTLKP